jgi:hypothetical protein
MNDKPFFLVGVKHPGSVGEGFIASISRETHLPKLPLCGFFLYDFRPLSQSQ